MLVQTKGRTGWHANTGSFMSLEEKQAAALKVMDMLAGIAGTGAGRLAA